MVPLLRLRPLTRLPRRACGVPLLPAPALARALARGRVWRVEGHRHRDPFGDGPPPLFLLVLHGPSASLWQALPQDAGRRRRLLSRGPRSDAPPPPARRCPALVRLLERILGAEGKHLRQRQIAALLDVARAAGAEDACAIAGLREARGVGIVRYRYAPAEDTLFLGGHGKPLPFSALPPSLRALLRQDPAEVEDDYGLAPQMFLSVRPADRSAHARLDARKRLLRRHGPGILDLLQEVP